VIQKLEELEFTTPVTFLVGENGSGKSTLLEAIAIATKSITVGSEGVEKDKTLESVRQLAFYMRLAWRKRTHRGFFLRAEDFFGYARRMAHIQEDLEKELKAVDEVYRDRSDYAKDLARMPYQTELAGIHRRYGEGLDQFSHGESFLQLFQSRFAPDGFYLLDEPEAPLSPVRQLAFISALKRMVEQDSQFIIATHSPILLAFPGATILSFDGGQIHTVSYESLEHVTVTRAFLDDPEAFLRRL
jgi:predicted ATPase